MDLQWRDVPYNRQRKPTFTNLRQPTTTNYHLTTENRYIPPHLRPTPSFNAQLRRPYFDNQQRQPIHQRRPTHQRQPVHQRQTIHRQQPTHQRQPFHQRPTIHQGHTIHKQHPTLKEEEPFVKLFFQVLQCLHHLAVLKLQKGGQVAFTFKRKVSELDSFIRPAMKTSAVDDKIKSVNRTWLSQVTQHLIDHYQTIMDERLDIIKSKSLSSAAVDRLISHAISWARRSYRKRLTQDVIALFYKTMAFTKPILQNPPTSTPATPNLFSARFTFPTVNRTPKRGRTTPSPIDVGKRAKTADTSSSQSLFSSDSDSDSHKLSQFIEILDVYPSPSTSDNQTPPVPKVRTSIKKIDSTPINRGQTYTRTTRQSTKATVLKPVYHRTDDKSTWNLPAVEKPILIIGASNLNRITNNDPEVEIHSFPGAKLAHMKTIVDEYQAHRETRNGPVQHWSQ